MGPADQDMEWTPAAIGGHLAVPAPPVAGRARGRRDAAEDAETGGGELTRKAHATIAKVTDDIGRRFQFHTPISAVRELVNDLVDNPGASDARFAAETAVSLIQPYAPHIAEELWGVLGHERLWEQPWPTYDPALLERDDLRAGRSGQRPRP